MEKIRIDCLQAYSYLSQSIGRTPVTEREVEPGDLGRKLSGRARSAKSSPATWGESLRVWHRAKA